MQLLIATVAAAFVVSALATPGMRRWARRIGLVDHPDAHRKLHGEPIPLGGGVVVLLALVCAVGAALCFSDSQRAQAAENIVFLASILAAGVTLCVVGLLDDRFQLRGRQKLAGQVLATAILVGAGLVIERVEFFERHFELGIVAIPFSMFWLLGAINAVNLLDGLDGLATSVGIILSLAVAAMAGLTGHSTEACVAIALAGALAGFLVYNRPPASIFLGDAGSMIIGLVLGALAIRCSLKGPTSVVLAAPMAIWAIPIFDVLMAILRRRLTGRSIYATDRGHLHHVLKLRGLSDRAVVVFVGSCCAATSLGATLSVYFKSESLAYGAVLTVCAVLVASRMFGYHESLLLIRRSKATLYSLIPSFSRADSKPHLNIQTRLCGSRQWQDLWQTLTTFADRFHLVAIDLNISLPRLGEEYHANWRHRGAQPAENRQWRAEIPLYAHGLPVGHLRLTGLAERADVFATVGELIAGIAPLETHLMDLLETLAPNDPPTRPAPVYSAPELRPAKLATMGVVSPTVDSEPLA